MAPSYAKLLGATDAFVQTHGLKQWIDIEKNGYNGPGGCGGEAYFPRMPSDRDPLVVERDGKLLEVEWPTGLYRALGTIDTLEKAVLVAWAKGHPVHGMGRYREILNQYWGTRHPDGFVLTPDPGTNRRVRGGHCGTVEDRGREESQQLEQLLITPSAEVRVLGTRTLVTVVVAKGTIFRPEPQSRGDWVQYLELQTDCPVVGRPPKGLIAEFDEHRTPDSLGGWLARSAWLEDAAVLAFEHIEAALVRWGAGDALIARAREARDDEVRHFRETSALASRCGHTSARARAEAVDFASIEEFAVDNATNGLVHETYAALLAEYQSEHAAHREVRELMARIAVDECAHAALSWDIAEWLDSNLTAEARARVRVQCTEATEDLLLMVEAHYPRELREEAGLPSAEAATKMVQALRETLWSS